MLIDKGLLSKIYKQLKNNKGKQLNGKMGRRLK